MEIITRKKQEYRQSLVQNGMEMQKELKSLFPFIFAVSAFLSVVLAFVWMDSDVFNLLATGRQWREYGILTQNTFTVIPGLEIVVEQWLWTVILSWIFDTASYTGMIVFNIMLHFALYISVYAFLRIKNTGKNISAVTASVITVLFLYHNLRPQLISAILLVLQCVIIEKAKKTGNIKWLLFMPVLMLAEINVHAPVWIMHFLLLLPYLVPSFRKSRFIQEGSRKFRIMLYGMTPVMAGTMMLNPYGIKMPAYLFSFLTPSWKNTIAIQEAGSVFESAVPIILLICSVLLMTAFIVIRVRKNEPLQFDCTLLCLIVLCTAFTSQKQSQYIILLLMYLAGECRQELCLAYQTIYSFFGKTNLIIFFGCLVCFSIAIICSSAEKSYQKFHAHDSMISIMEADMNGEKKAVFTCFNTGNVLEYYGYPVYMDSRPELYTPYITGSEKNYLEEYAQCISGQMSQEDFSKLLDQYGIGYIYADYLPDQYRNLPGWEETASGQLNGHDQEVFLIKKISFTGGQLCL